MWWTLALKSQCLLTLSHSWPGTIPFTLCGSFCDWGSLVSTKSTFTRAIVNLCFITSGTAVAASCSLFAFLVFASCSSYCLYLRRGLSFASYYFVFLSDSFMVWQDFIQPDFTWIVFSFRLLNKITSQQAPEQPSPSTPPSFAENELFNRYYEMVVRHLYQLCI